MPRLHIMRPPYGRRTVLLSTVCKIWLLKIVRSCGLRKLWSQMSRRPHGDRTIHEIKNRKVTARRAAGDRTATSRLLPYGRRKGVVRPPKARREAAVRFSRHLRQGKNRMPPHDHRKAIVRPPRCGCVVAALRFLKKVWCHVKKNRKVCDAVAAC